VARPISLPTTSRTFGPQAAGSNGPPSITSGRVKYLGHSGIRETAGGAVTVTIRENGSATGAVLSEIVVGAYGLVNAVWFGPQGVDGRVGLYLHIESGTGLIEGSAFVG
jgi:hypothetical protein